MAIVLSENFRALFYAPFYAAYATGSFADAGVEVVLRSSPAPSATVRALRTGAIDVMWGGPLRVMMTHDAEPDADLVCFADVVARDPFFVIGRRARPDFRLGDLAQMKFATVSEVPTPWICLADDLRRAGVDLARLDRVCGPTMAENAIALREGKLDAVHLFQPYAEELLASGAGHLWYAAASRGLTAYTTLVTRRSTLQDRAGELLAMTRAMRAALRWFAKTPADEIADALKRYFPDVAPAMFAAAIERYRKLGLWGADPLIRREGYDRLHAAMRAAGVLSRDIAYETCVDTSLARQAIADSEAG
ncbi:MAG: ABC transporter substrate-binding protein [Alphaproteobacteria bacterium]|nr:ABC transporter substrate-binding protein [Alphaproteobacteria bacterium]MBV8411622.1 ABC transporter substrate-binding protein [Alphaproteobacteria bacterium]